MLKSIAIFLWFYNILTLMIICLISCIISEQFAVAYFSLLRNTLNIFKSYISRTMLMKFKNQSTQSYNPDDFETYWKSRLYSHIQLFNLMAIHTFFFTSYDISLFQILLICSINKRTAKLHIFQTRIRSINYFFLEILNLVVSI